MTVVELDEVDETRRDRWGRYMVVPPSGSKPTAYTRATTVAKAIEDQHSLIAWKSRVTAKGLTVRGELLKMIAVTDDRAKLDDLCEQAAQAGGATERRDEGTALHRALELAMTGAKVPELFAGDVTAVHAELARHGLSVVPGMTERMCVDDTRRIAGTFDLIVTDGTTNWVADFKTGATLEYSGLAFSVQLAIYAWADALYVQGKASTGKQDRREPMPPVARDLAFVLHVQPGSGACTLHDVDIARGAEWLALCLSVREARSAARSRNAGLIVARRAPQTSPVVAAGSQAAEPPVEQKPPAATAPAGTTRREKVIERLLVLKECSPDEYRRLGAAWPEGLPLPQSGHLYTRAEFDAIDELLATAEGRCGAPFTTRPTEDVAQPAPTWLNPPAPATKATPLELDNGAPVDAEVATAALDALRALPKAAQDWAVAVLTEAKNAGVPVSLRAAPTQRMLDITRAIAAWATTDDDELVRAGLVFVVGDERAQPGFPLGAVIGALALDESAAFAALPARIDAGSVSYVVDAQGERFERTTP